VNRITAEEMVGMPTLELGTLKVRIIEKQPLVLAGMHNPQARRLNWGRRTRSRELLLTVREQLNRWPGRSVRTQPTQSR
jgi:hypothetical protein